MKFILFACFKQLALHYMTFLIGTFINTDIGEDMKLSMALTQVIW